VLYFRTYFINIGYNYLKFSQNVSNRYLLIVREFRNDTVALFFITDMECMSQANSIIVTHICSECGIILKCYTIRFGKCLVERYAEKG